MNWKFILYIILVFWFGVIIGLLSSPDDCLNACPQAETKLLEPLPDNCLKVYKELTQDMTELDLLQIEFRKQMRLQSGG